MHSTLNYKALVELKLEKEAVIEALIELDEEFDEKM